MSEPETVAEAEDGPAGRGITVDDLRADAFIQGLLTSANTYLDAAGYTEHGQRHADRVSALATMILRELGHAERTCELGGVAAYLHDIGNVIARDRHHVSSAFIAYDYLRAHGIEVDELTPVLSAIGNHEESIGVPVGSVAAAVIIADKSDVHRSRVQNEDKSTFDIHDRVNWSAVASDVQVDREDRVIALEIEIDTAMSTVMEYFEIFLSRMVMCRAAAKKLGCRFELVINGQRLS
jgi:metal-dependent HD superfamily phosphatase/phosphodiesterase